MNRLGRSGTTSVASVADDAPGRRPIRRALGLGPLLLLGFTLMMVPLIVVVVLAGSRLREMQAQSEHLVEQRLPRLLAMQELVEHAQGHGAAMARLLTAPRLARERIYPELDAESAAIDHLIDALRAGAPLGERAANLSAMDAARLRYRTVFASVGEALEGGDPNGAATLFAAQGLPALQTLIEQARQLRTAEQALMVDRQLAMAERIRQAEWQLAAVSLAAVLLAGLVAWRTARSITRPMQHMAQVARRLGAGDYAQRVRTHAALELERVAAALNSMADAVAAREAELERVAFVDPVTGLPNRSAIRRRLQNEGQAWSVVVLDIARLGTVNEVMGYEAGNALLRAAADHLTRLVTAHTADGPVWMPGCLGGGVFALISNGATVHDAQAMVTTLTRPLSLAIDASGAPIDLHFVAGIATNVDAPDAESLTGSDADRLLQLAEQAAAEAKRQGTGWAWHRPEDPSRRLRQLGLLGGLRDAAADGSLAMWLQPKLRCLADAALAPQVHGFEALVRWQHPQWGWVSPADFVPFAERAGQIHLITDAMLSRAMAVLAAWHAQGVPWTIAVNVSTADLLDPGFPARVRDLAQRTGAPLTRLRLEITESRLMQDADRVLAVMCALRDDGVQWSIDDFGTGYSSLAYLQRLPVTELKIDRSFVSDADRSPERSTLLRTIVALAHGLGLKVTAEGVERAEELALLADAGCDCVQGYLMARPKPVAEAEAFARGAPASPRAASAAVGSPA